MGLDDDDLLALLAKDIDKHYERLVSMYWHQLYSFVLRRRGSPQDAEDIVQDAFVRAYLALSRYSAERVRSLKVRPWLYKITWNIYCNYSNTAKSSPTLPLDTSEDGPFLEQEDSENEQPEHIFERLERRGELEALVNSLPERYRDIVSLYYFAELTHQEVAEILNQPVGTIKVYVHRGIRLLRKALAIQTNEVS